MVRPRHGAGAEWSIRLEYSMGKHAIECSDQRERRWQVQEIDKDTEVLVFRERQLRNIPEELV
jgi:hypothetical protein